MISHIAVGWPAATAEQYHDLKPFANNLFPVGFALGRGHAQTASTGSSHQAPFPEHILPILPAQAHPSSKPSAGTGKRTSKLFPEAVGQEQIGQGQAELWRLKAAMQLESTAHHLMGLLSHQQQLSASTGWWLTCFIGCYSCRQLQHNL